jgi:signal transduction histidine kinase/CheY-like chemotaxis protein
VLVWFVGPITNHPLFFVRASLYSLFAELNDFIAHEVRNPLAAAMSACAFVSSAITEDNRTRARNDDDFDEEKGMEECTALISSDEKRKEVQDDIKIIDSSLHFINDLLRNMLDMQRAGANQIRIENQPTDIMEDVFKPVRAMLHLRELPFEVILECSCNRNDFEDDVQLFIMTDPLRLKQVLLNLTRNAVKFVEKGFVRCGAKVNVDDGLVEIYVDDSGPGIPSEKRGQVFGKFQESLDSLQQGTGIGLSLCKKLVDLMGGSLYIDDNYRSGVEGCPGTRFVVQLKIPPLQLNNAILDSEMSRHEKTRRLRQIASSSKLSSSYSSLPIKRSMSSPSLAKATLESTTDRSKTDTACTVMEYTPLASPTETTLSFSENTPDLNAKTTIDRRLNSSDDTKEEEQLSTKEANSAGHNVAVAENTGKKERKNSVEKHQHKFLLTELPENLSVLFVDDDMIVRKLFSRTLKKLNPSWTLQEASNGETAIEIITSAMQQLDDRVALKLSVEEEDSSSFDDYNGFDLIFMDQYMASVQKQLLGTETVRAIRAKGIHTPIICGLSANDVEDAFLHAGSDAFMFKPFPCKQDVLKKELLRIINIRRVSKKRHGMF